MLLTITPLQGAATEIAAPPDIRWNGFVGDFAVNVDRGLESSLPLETAVLMLLFTDAPADAGDLRYEHRGDSRGWPGDALDVQPLGSTLWLFRRRELTDQVAMLVRAEIERALQPLIEQQAVVTISVATVANKVAGRIDASIDLFGRDGSRLYASKFELIWRGR